MLADRHKPTLTTDRDPLLDGVAHRVTMVLHTSGAIVALRNNGKWTINSSAGIADGDCIDVEVMLAGDLLQAADVAVVQEADMFLYLPHGKRRGEAIRSLAAAAIVGADGQQIGAIVVVHNAVRPFSDADQECLRQFASHTAHVLVCYTRMQEALASRDALQKARDAALAASQAKSNFLANMSHELRTPLTVMLGFADEVLSANLSREEIDDHVQTISTSGHQLLGLVNDVLDLSKIEAGRFDLEMILFSPREIIDGVLKQHRAKADQKGVALTLHEDSALPQIVRSDPTRFRQIVANLVSNALKFTERGSVDVRMRHDSVTRRLEVSVSDTGIGISEEQRETIFQPYMQADCSTRRRFGGTGLGLAISRQLARMLGGDIEVLSAGQGSVFHASIDVSSATASTIIPIVRMTVAPPNGAAFRDDLQGASGTVLLVEDTPELRKLFSRYLTRAGYEVQLAENGAIALSVVKAAKKSNLFFDLIVMDMQMPEMGGEEATALLRADGCVAPIIALTANAMRGDRERCLEIGCDDYLAKPVSRDVLLKTAAHYIERAKTAKEEPILSLLVHDTDIVDLLESFVATLMDRVEKVRLAVAANDRAEGARVAHQLRGASGNYGFPRLMELAARIEYTLAQSENSVDQMVEELAGLCRRVRATP